MIIKVNINQDEDGYYCAHSDDLKGVYGQGKTFNEAFIDYLKGLTVLLEYLQEEKKPLKLEGVQVVNIDKTSTIAT